MLLFADGFENFHPTSIGEKWTSFSSSSGIIVFGDDTNHKPPVAFARKDGKAFKCRGLSAYQEIPKSRTVFCGFAFRTREENGNDYKIIDVKFYSRDKKLVATARHLLYSDTIDVQWLFADGGVENQYGQIFCPLSPYSGEYHYLECGMTVFGNSEDGASAWVESRMGTRTSRIENVFTAKPGGDNSHFLTGVGLSVDWQWRDYTQGAWIFDDFYICNDEGSQNNSFLGDVRIRSRVPTGDASVNDSFAVNTTVGGRYTGVDTSYVRTDGVSIPTPEPDPDQDPLYIRWDDPTSSYLQLQRPEDAQTLWFRHTNFAGSEPRIFGAILHSFAKTNLENPRQNTRILPIVKAQGLTTFVKGSAPRVPLGDSLKCIHGILENDEGVNYESGAQPVFWNPVVFNNAEFGWQLEKFASEQADLEDACPTYLRHKIISDENLKESLECIDTPSRFAEEQLQSSFGTSDETSYQRTFRINEGVSIQETNVFGARACIKWLNSVLYAKDEIPWHYLWASDGFSFSEKVNFLWLENVLSQLALSEFTTGFWVEEFNDGFVFSGRPVRSNIFTIEDSFSSGELVQSNHILIDESLLLESSYVWSGHEFLGETLYPDDNAVFAWKMDLEDFFTTLENHFDGNWVERMGSQNSLQVEILTQHWRHEWFMGVCIESWQIKPLEQPGATDGNRVGDLSAQYWQAIGYLNDPREI